MTSVRTLHRIRMAIGMVLYLPAWLMFWYLVLNLLQAPIYIWYALGIALALGFTGGLLGAIIETAVVEQRVDEKFDEYVKSKEDQP